MSKPHAGATADVGVTKPFAFEAGAAQEDSPAACRIEGLVLPDDAKVYAAGAYSGAPTDFQIDQSGHEATSIQVAVNQTDAPVVLLLGAYEPTVWSVGWTPGTRIAAVLLTGYHRQRVTGLPSSVPMLVSTHENRGPCGYAYVGSDGMAKLNPMARQVFGRAVDVAYTARDGRVVVGQSVTGAALITDAGAPPVEDFRLKGVPPAGQAGLDAALRDGVLRATTQADVLAWESAKLAYGAPEDLAANPRRRGAHAVGTLSRLHRAQGLPDSGWAVRRPFGYVFRGAGHATAHRQPGPFGDPRHQLGELYRRHVRDALIAWRVDRKPARLRVDSLSACRTDGCPPRKHGGLRWRNGQQQRLRSRCVRHRQWPSHRPPYWADSAGDVSTRRGCRWCDAQLAETVVRPDSNRC